MFFLFDIVYLCNSINLLFQDKMWFVHDGAPAHTAGDTVRYLDRIFPQKWIGNNSPNVQWPARSPDLNTMDYYAWGTIKDSIFKTDRYYNKQQLQNSIVEAFDAIQPDEIRKATRNFEDRLTYCSAAEGFYFEQFL